MQTEEGIALIEDYVMTVLACERTGHDYAHISRVVYHAKQLAVAEGLNARETFLVHVAALLHDVVDDKVVSDLKQAECEVLSHLETIGLDLAERENIWHSITHLSYRKQLDHSQVLSHIGQIVQDADRLDAIGAIGIARAFYYGGAKGHALTSITPPRNKATLTAANYREETSVVNHFHEKLLHLEGLMNTLSGKALARQRTQFMRDYLAQLDQELPPLT